MANKNNSDQDYTWWFYSLGLYRQVLGILGFKIEKIHKSKHLFVHTNTMAERQTSSPKEQYPWRWHNNPQTPTHNKNTHPEFAY